MQTRKLIFDLNYKHGEARQIQFFFDFDAFNYFSEIDLEILKNFITPIDLMIFNKIP